MTQQPPQAEPEYGPGDPLRSGASLPPYQRIRLDLTWFLVGAVTAAVLGWLALLLAAEIIGSESSRITQIRNEAASAAYQLAIDQAVSQALDDEVTVEIAQQLAGQDVGRDSPWADGFRRGWADGWDDALDAMRAASIEAGAADNSPELALLDAEVRRNPVR